MKALLLVSVWRQKPADRRDMLINPSLLFINQVVYVRTQKTPSTDLCMAVESGHRS